ncbi:hypothetical protein Lfu02_26830 [Longispora fulva]|uniref:Putative membrane protein YeaQ/YmgE (Transglycosylase-associated protein family) n=1 Tax=Longispora fulva TaxID=619741 RepID=A0A8J7KM61_9ACTN|nr:putative membrane protein YeaQ/YmgE (transglycosylase-associated protein family) [Longispora fulva]GIG58311.1 hypothetical protein Lfu02_26830 [Longispora fulva]
MTYPTQDPNQWDPNQHWDPNQPVTGAPYPPQYAYPPQYVARRTNGLAIAAMVTSICALVMCFGSFGFIGAILGHVARKQIRERDEEGDGMALAGIIIGWIGTAIGVLVIAFYVVFFVWAFNEANNHTYDGY